MQIMPFTASVGQSNSTYDSANAAAQHEKFSNMLREVQEKADAAMSAEESSAEKQRKGLREACQGFEALFLDMMFREMRKTVPKDELFGESNAMDIFRDMHDTEVMKQMSSAGGIGIADMMYKQLSPQIERQIANLQKTQKTSLGNAD